MLLRQPTSSWTSVFQLTSRSEVRPVPGKSAVAQLFHSVFCVPESLTRQLIAMVLIWAMVLSGMPAYAADVKSAQRVAGMGSPSLSGPTDQAQPRPESGPGPQRKPARREGAPRLTQVAAATSPVLFGPSSVPLPAMLAGVFAPPVQASGSGSPVQISVGFAD